MFSIDAIILSTINWDKIIVASSNVPTPCVGSEASHRQHANGPALAEAPRDLLSRWGRAWTGSPGSDSLEQWSI